MAIPLKQSTASQEIPLGYFVDSTDGNTEETALTIANTDIKLWKAGATTLANKNSGGATHISNGLYYCVLDATDTNTLGPLVAFVHVAGALAVRVECVVHPAQVFDSLYGADILQVDVSQWNNANIATPDTAGYPKVTNKVGTGTGELSLSSGLVSANVTQWTGTNVATPDTAGYPKVTNKVGTGTGELSITSGLVSANATQISGDATAADNLEAILDGTRAKLYLTGIDIVAASNDNAIKAIGSGTGAGARFEGGATGSGIDVFGSATGDGLHVEGNSGIFAQGSAEAGIYGLGGGPDVIGMKLDGGTGAAGLVVDDETLAGAVLNALTAEFDAAGTIGEAIGSGGGGGGGGDVTSIYGSVPAASNLRKMFDGTGYNASTSAIGSVGGVVNANLQQFLGSSTVATLLYRLAQGVTYGTAVAGTLSTTEMTTNLTETTNNHWKPPSVIKWLTGSLAGQARAVTGYVGSNKKIQYQTATEAPAAGDTFVIL